MTDPRIEVVAAVIDYELRRGELSGDACEQTTEECSEGIAVAVLAALDAMPNADKVMPKEPTREMWAAGGDAIVNLGHVHHDQIIGAAWSAMYAAAPALSPNAEFRRGWEVGRDAAMKACSEKAGDIRRANTYRGKVDRFGEFGAETIETAMKAIAALVPPEDADA